MQVGPSGTGGVAPLVSVSRSSRPSTTAGELNKMETWDGPAAYCKLCDVYVSSNVHRISNEPPYLYNANPRPTTREGRGNG